MFIALELLITKSGSTVRRACWMHLYNKLVIVIGLDLLL